MNSYRSIVVKSFDAEADCLVQISSQLFHTFLGFVLRFFFFVLNFFSYLKSLKKYFGCCYGFFSWSFKPVL